MKNLLIFFLLLSAHGIGQKGLFMRSDTMWQIKGVNVGDTVALLSSSQTKGVLTTANITTALGYTPSATTRYAIQVQALTSSPADATTYYFGMLPKAPVTAANTSKIYIRRAGIIKVAEIYCYSGTAGTNEAWPIYIRLNNTTDTQIASLSVNTNERVFSNTNLSIAVNTGDYIEIKTVTPIFATNPLTTIFSGFIIIE